MTPAPPVTTSRVGDGVPSPGLKSLCPHNTDKPQFAADRTHHAGRKRTRSPAFGYPFARPPPLGAVPSIPSMEQPAGQARLPCRQLVVEGGLGQWQTKPRLRCTKLNTLKQD